MNARGESLPPGGATRLGKRSRAFCVIRQWQLARALHGDSSCATFFATQRRVQLAPKFKTLSWSKFKANYMQPQASLSLSLWPSIRYPRPPLTLKLAPKCLCLPPTWRFHFELSFSNEPASESSAIRSRAKSGRNQTRGCCVYIPKIGLFILLSQSSALIPSILAASLSARLSVSCLFVCLGPKLKVCALESLFAIAKRERERQHNGSIRSSA